MLFSEEKSAGSVPSVSQSVRLSVCAWPLKPPEFCRRVVEMEGGESSENCCLGDADLPP